MALSIPPKGATGRSLGNAILGLAAGQTEDSVTGLLVCAHGEPRHPYLLHAHAACDLLVWLRGVWSRVSPVAFVLCGMRDWVLIVSHQARARARGRRFLQRFHQGHALFAPPTIASPDSYIHVALGRA